MVTLIVEDAELPIKRCRGDRDIAGPAHQIPSGFPRSADLTLLVLPSTGHCHFLFDSRRRLFERAAAWCETILPKP